ncbi:hypothetical protein K435DRAFT_784730, partial [Dendrothele bispora CBS 962.96]
MPVHRPTPSVRGRTLLRQPRSSAVPVQRTASSDPQAGRPVTTTNRSRTTHRKKNWYDEWIKRNAADAENPQTV